MTERITRKMNTEALKVERLSKIYPQPNRKSVLAVDNISFLVKRGEIVGLLGPNGAGKTTTIKSICGLVTPSSGHIFIEGIDTLRSPKFGMSKISAVLEGNRNIYWRLTPRENLTFFAGLQGISYRDAKLYIDELIELFNLTSKTNTQARFLSRGMQQKLAVACALAKKTDILLLDEPTLGLDVESSHELQSLIKDIVRDNNRTVLISSHDMQVVKNICDRVIIINKGKVVTDERVDRLAKLFETSSYRFELTSKLTQEDENKIKSRFDLANIMKTDEHTAIDIELRSHERLYELIDILRNNGSKIDSITHKEPDFEEIFLKIVKNET
jgi:ABC-2 type transport system ATP-binding protein